MCVVVTRRNIARLIFIFLFVSSGGTALSVSVFHFNPIRVVVSSGGAASYLLAFTLVLSLSSGAAAYIL